jgi:hypothetical protein
MDEDETGEQKSVFDRAQQKVALLKSLADLYTSYLMDGGIRPDDYYALFYSLVKKEKINNPLNPDLPKFLETVEIYQDRHHFFHWPFEFPDVFGPDAVGGFSANIGNPPWDIVKPNSQEFFSDYDSRFRSYDKQKANRESAKLTADNPIIAEKWEQYCNGFAEQSAYFKEAVSYCALGKGDINTFKLFLEQFFTLLHDGGRMGIVVPSGIYTDQGCKPMRELFFSRSSIEFLYCFENRWPTVFSAVDGRFKFVTFGTKKGGSTDWFKCAFMEHDPERLSVIDADALKMSVDQVRNFSPDTLSVMEFKSQRDIDVTTKIYGDWPLLGETIENAWNVQFKLEIHKTNSSHLLKNTVTDLPLFDGKMIHQFDNAYDEPRNWLNRKEVEEHLGASAWQGTQYRFSYREISASTNERTFLSAVIPPCFHGHKLPTAIPYHKSFAPNSIKNSDALWLTSLTCSFVVDFLLRKKVTTSISFFYVYSLPIPRIVSEKYLSPIVARCARLSSTISSMGNLWGDVFINCWQYPTFWYPSPASINTYGPAHEQETRRRLRDEAKNLTPEWGPHCGVHDRLPDRRDTGDRAQLRAEIDAYVAHLYGLSRDDFAYILDTFPVLKKKEKKAFGEFMSKRKCLEEYDRVEKTIAPGYSPL